jgi:hypothetical protein
MRSRFSSLHPSSDVAGVGDGVFIEDLRASARTYRASIKHASLTLQSFLQFCSDLSVQIYVYVSG